MQKKLLIIILVIAGVLLSGILFVSNQVSAPTPTESEQTKNEQYANRLVGTWQSTEDENAVVSYRANGTTEDRYDSEVLAEGTWEIYTDSAAAYNASGYFLRTTIDGETYEYAILDLAADTLRLNYLARGNMLEYQRISE